MGRIAQRGEVPKSTEILSIRGIVHSLQTDGD